MGDKETTELQEFKATYVIPYESGELKAFGLENGKEVQEVMLKTAGKPAKIKLEADRKTITADSQDLVYVRVEITDENGFLNPNAGNELTFKVTGAGTIAGVDNASLKDSDLYVGNTRKAWHGRAMVIIKSNNESGIINLKVTSSGLNKAVITIQSIKKK